jgi:hypothetical protein
MDLKETDILGADIASHWYYSSKAKAMTQLLKGAAPQKILDVGAGSGFFSRYLLAHTTAREAWCVDISYPKDTDESDNGKAVYYRRSVGAIDDDVALLNEYVDKVPSGSRFLITVPAFKFLWSGHDDFLEHKRRYTLKQLEETVRKADLQVTQGAYYFGMVFPIAAALRLAQNASHNAKPARSQLARHHPAVNMLLSSLCSAELHVLPFNRVAGLSVFCLAEKK